jgi:hypothetical protein
LKFFFYPWLVCSLIFSIFVFYFLSVSIGLLCLLVSLFNFFIFRKKSYRKNLSTNARFISPASGIVSKINLSEEFQEIEMTLSFLRGMGLYCPVLSEVLEIKKKIITFDTEYGNIIFIFQHKFTCFPMVSDVVRPTGCFGKHSGLGILRIQIPKHLEILVEQGDSLFALKTEIFAGKL